MFSNEHSYIRDEETSILMKPDYRSIRYSDGSDVEIYLLENLKNVQDHGTFSPEIRALIKDWPTEYHLSTRRHGIVRPLGIQPGQTVLELGSGCGAITRYLGEIGAIVTSVEGSLPRARIARERCKGMDNVQIICDDLQHVALDQKFDWVFLIGVLEYAPMFCTDADPIATYLKIATRHLSDSGSLVVAIENKMGVKYFNGCLEDHLARRFVGIEGLYTSKSAVTFGKKELNKKLSSAGFSNIEFLYPYPDYKIPNLVLNSSAFSDEDLYIPDMLSRHFARDYNGTNSRIFNEILVQREMYNNDLLEGHMNSFLVIANSSTVKSTKDLAQFFNFDRSASAATQTDIFRQDGKLSVRKTMVGCPNTDISTNVPSILPYQSGKLAIWPLIEDMARGVPDQQVAKTLSSWFHFLLSSAKIPQDSKPNSNGELALQDMLIESAFIDATPFNIVENEDSKIVIDQEWSENNDISFGYVVTRCILHSLKFPILKQTTYDLKAIISFLCKQYNIAFDPTYLNVWLEWESDFQASLGARKKTIPSIVDFRLMPFFKK